MAGVGALLVLLAGGFLSGCGGQDESPRSENDTNALEQLRASDPEGYSRIDAALQPLREHFEASFGRPRLVAVVAPTCGNCVQNALAIAEGLLPSLQRDDLEVFFVWSSILVTDVEPRAVRRIEEFSHPAITHYWDEHGRVARAFSQTLQVENQAYDCYFLYGPDATWDPENTMRDEPSDRNVLLEGWAPSTPVTTLTSNRAMTAFPGFSVGELQQSLESLASDAETGH